MPVSTHTEIDQLYRLPLDEFTAARNALAKGAKNAAEIKALTKPPLAAWAVNQLYWRDRRTWDALIDAAENLRRTHKAVLGGKSGDVRAAGAAHDAAVQDATKATLALLDTPATDAVKQAVVNTLRALPADDPPGRLTRVLQPGGFEMLAGLSISGRAPATHGKAGTTKHEKTPATPEKAARSKADTRALTQAREAAAAASHALRAAEQSVRRHEFEIARATRDEERGDKAVEQAEAALAEAKAALAAAERDRADAKKRRTAAEQALDEAQHAVVAARKQADAAAAALKKVQTG